MRILILLPTLVQLTAAMNRLILLAVSGGLFSCASSVTSGAAACALIDVPPCVAEADSRAISAASVKPPSRPISSKPVAATVNTFASLSRSCMQNQRINPIKKIKETPERTNMEVMSVPPHCVQRPLEAL